MSFKIVGCRVYFFHMELLLEDGEQLREKKRAAADEDKERGIHNDQLDWRLTLKCFNLTT